MIKNINNKKNTNTTVDSYINQILSCKKQLHNLENVFNKHKKFTEKRLMEFQELIDTQESEVNKLAKKNLDNYNNDKKLNHVINQVIDLKEYIKQFKNSLKKQQRLKKDKFINLKTIIDDKLCTISHSTQKIKRETKNTTDDSFRNLEQEIKKSFEDFGKEINDGIKKVGESIFDNFKNLDQE